MVSTPKVMSLDDELKALQNGALKGKDNQYLPAPYALSYDEVVNNDESIAQIIESAKPIGLAGSSASYETESAARLAAEKLFLIVSKFHFDGKAAGTGIHPTPAIPAGTDWLRKGDRTKKAVGEFFSEIISPTALLKWQIAKGG